jgi:carbamoyltransferase
MGLAPYGKPQYLSEMQQIVRLKPDGGYVLDLTFFRHQDEKIRLDSTGASPEVVDLFKPALEKLLGPRRSPAEPIEDRHRDIARSTQAIYEAAFINLLNVLYERHKIPNIALAGGCAMNSVANGKIRRMTPFKNVYVQSAAGDAGGAIGAAFAVWHKHSGKRSFVMEHANWGPHFGLNYIQNVLKENASRIAESGCRVEHIHDEQELCRRTAQTLLMVK